MSRVRRKVGPLDVAAAIVGVQILVKGWEKLPYFDRHPLVVTFLLLLGGFVLVGAALTSWIEKRTENAHALFHAAEGVAIGLSALLLLEKGKVRIPLLLLFIGLCYLAVGLIESQPPARRARLVGPMQKSSGGAFVAAGLVLAGFTAFQDRSVWAFITAGLLAVIGSVLLLRRPGLVGNLAEASGPPPETGPR